MRQRSLHCAVDNDVVFKAVCYDLASGLWPGVGATYRVGVLGAARYVVSDVIDRGGIPRDKAAAREALAALLAVVSELEPTGAELTLAAELELVAQRAGLSLDAGESQLCAMVIERRVSMLDTGDKRAVRSLEKMLDAADRLRELCGKVRCLEQLFRALIDDAAAFERAANVVCSELDPLALTDLGQCA